MDPDFSRLYVELGLPADCSLEEYKRAYRRRVALLHPDRNGGMPASAESQAALRSLFAANAAVDRFHRRHGRMPGAAGSQGVTSPWTRATSGGRAPAAPPTGSPPSRSTRATLGLAIVFVVLLVLLASRDWLDIVPG